MAGVTERNIIMRGKDAGGNEILMYPATKLENVVGAEEALSEKANAEEVNEELGKKANGEDVDNALSGKVDKEANEAAMAKKADLQDGIVPDKQLPYYSKTQDIYINGILLYPVIFVDIDKNGDVYLREDGSGDYLLYVPIDGIPRLRYTGNVVTDNVTGAKYSFTVSNGTAVAQAII